LKLARLPDLSPPRGDPQIDRMRLAVVFAQEGRWAEARGVQAPLDDDRHANFDFFAGYMAALSLIGIPDRREKFPRALRALRSARRRRALRGVRAARGVDDHLRWALRWTAAAAEFWQAVECCTLGQNERAIANCKDLLALPDLDADMHDTNRARSRCSDDSRARSSRQRSTSPAHRHNVLRHTIAEDI
jgi:hypothetical protein